VNQPRKKEGEGEKGAGSIPINTISPFYISVLAPGKSYFLRKAPGRGEKKKKKRGGLHRFARARHYSEQLICPPYEKEEGKKERGRAVPRISLF